MYLQISTQYSSTFQAMIALGNLYLSKKDVKRAQETYENLQKHHKDNSYLNLQLANIFLNSDHLDEERKKKCLKWVLLHDFLKADS